MKMKKFLAHIIALTMLVLLLAPSAPAVAAKTARSNPITSVGIRELPEDGVIRLEDGCYFNFNPKIISRRTKGKTTGLVWWEVEAATNTAGVSSSRWGYVYPACEGSFRIRALAFASAQDLEAWKQARKANGNVADEAINSLYTTAVSEWAKITVTSEKPGYAVARTQYQLNLALKNKKCTDIHIVTEKEKTLEIKAGNYRKKTLTVNAPKADVVNSALFSHIYIEQIKKSTYVEKADGNQISVTAPSARIVIDESASVESLSLNPVPSQGNPEPQVEVVGLGGTVNQIEILAPGDFVVAADADSGLKVGAIEVEASSTVSISMEVSCLTEGKAVPVAVAEEAGSARIETGTKLEVNTSSNIEIVINQSTTAGDAAATIINLLKAITAAISGTAADTIVNVTEVAAGAVVKTSTTVKINASADITVELEEGAEDTVVEREEGVKVELAEDSNVDVTVVNPDGSSESLVPGETAEATVSPTPTPTAAPTPTAIPTPPPVSTPTPFPTPTPMEDVEIDWKDENLENVIREIIGVTDRPIRLSDVAEIKELDLYGKGIQDISALKSLTGLTELTIGEDWEGAFRENPIGGLSALSELKNLKILVLFNCGVDDISVLGGLEGLEELNLNANPLEDISPLAGLANLRYLYICATKVHDITPLKGLVKLEELILNNNGGISDVSALSGLTELKLLGIYISEVNNISPLAPLTKLECLSVGGCGIHDISVVAGMKELKELYINETDVRDIDALSGLTNLEYFNAENTKVSNISALSGMADLEVVDLGGRQVKDIRVLADMDQLTELHLGYGGEDGEGIIDISALKGKTKLEAINLGGHRVSDISALADMSQLRELWLSYGGNDGEGITNISALEGKANLEVLYLDGHRITDIRALAGMEQLRELGLSYGSDDGGGITDISALEGKANLEVLNLDGHRISDISPLITLAEGENSLKEVYLNGCPNIPQSDLAKLKELVLGLSYDERDYDDHDMVWKDEKLEEAMRELTGIMDRPIRLSDVYDWDSLRIETQGIQNVEALAELVNLRSVEITDSGFTNIAPFAGMQNLVELHFGNWEEGSLIEDISALSGMTWLECLEIQNGMVSNIDALANLTNLRRLSLNYGGEGSGGITDISVLEGKVNLEYVDLNGHRITDISVLADMDQLKGLGLSYVEGDGMGITDISALQGKVNME